MHDGVVSYAREAVGLPREQDLGAYPVNRRHQHRVPMADKVEESSEMSNVTHDVRVEGFPNPTAQRR
jgi:hypothetical protein